MITGCSFQHQDRVFIRIFCPIGARRRSGEASRAISAYSSTAYRSPLQTAALGISCLRLRSRLIDTNDSHAPPGTGH